METGSSNHRVPTPQRKPRSDKGRHRVLDQGTTDAVLDFRRLHPQLGLPSLTEKLLAQGVLKAGAFSGSTLQRRLAENRLDRRSLRKSEQKKCPGEGQFCSPQSKLRWKFTGFENAKLAGLPGITIAFIRYGVLTCVKLLRDCGFSLQEAVNIVSQTPWPDGQGLTYSAGTIEEWWYAFLKHGIAGILPHTRSDKGTIKALTAEDCTFLTQLLKDNPQETLTKAHRQLLMQERGEAKPPSDSTVARYLRKIGFNRASRKRLKQQTQLVRDDNSWMLSVLQGQLQPESLVSELMPALSEKEIQVLYDSVTHKPLRFRNRALAILSYHKGITNDSIERFLGAGKGFADGAARVFRKRGIRYAESNTRRGANKFAEDRYKEAVFAILHSPPSAHGINRTSWRMTDVQRLMAERGLSICCAGIRTIIHEAGYSMSKAKKVLTSNDPDYRKKLQDITNILRNLKPDEKFFSVDEFGPFAVKMQGGRSLVGPGEIRTVPQRQKSKGSLIVTAALELSENQVTHFYSKRKNTDEMLKLLDLLLAKYVDQSCIYFSWDAASWHASKKLYKRVEEINSREYRATHKGPLVKLAPLPACAQFLNVIESVFSGMARAIIHNSDYSGVPECEAAIDRYFQERNDHFKAHPKRAGDKIWGKELVPPTFSESNNCKDPRYRGGHRSASSTLAAG
jgi:transposase